MVTVDEEAKEQPVGRVSDDHEQIVSDLAKDEDVQPLLKPPDGGWGWVIVLASFTCILITEGTESSFIVFYVELRKLFKSDSNTSIWFWSLLPTFHLIVGPLASALTNKFGFRRMTIAGSALGCTALILAQFSPNVNCLMWTYGVMGGVASGLIYLPAVVSVCYYFEKKRVLALAIVLFASKAGVYNSAIAAYFVVEKCGWGVALAILTGIFLICGVCGGLMRPLEVPLEDKTWRPLEVLRKWCPMADSTRTSLDSNQEIESAFPKNGFDMNIGDNSGSMPSSSKPGNKSSRRMMDFSLFKNALFWSICMCHLFALTIGFVPFRNLAKDILLTFPAYLVLIVSATGIVLCGLLMYIPKLDSFIVINLALLLSGVCLFLLPFCNSQLLFTAFYFLFDFFISIYIYLTPVVLVDLLGQEKLSNVLGWIMLFRAAAYISGPRIAGAINASHGKKTLLYVAGISTVVLAILSSLLIGFQRIKIKSTHRKSSIELQGSHDVISS